MHSEISREHTGSCQWQIQEGHQKLICYASKTLPPACKNYSVTELEMTGLLVNIALWKVYLKQCEFDACIDHAAVVQILKAKTEPAANHNMRLLDRLSPYCFNLYYVKGKDMILPDYLSQNRLTDNYTSDLIPSSFHSFHLFLHHHGLDTLHITTRSQAKAAGQATPKVHGVDKGLDPHLKPEHQSRSTTNVIPKQAPPNM